jgi:hypothetical protein
MFKDLTFAIRTLKQNPGFALVAILSLALAIAANTTVYSLAEALVLRPAAIPDPRTACRAGESASITQRELVHRTQELLDGIVTGHRQPFERYFVSNHRKALVADITPLPPHISATLTLTHPESRIVGDTAILSYDMDETETISGQAMQARYHATDTWLRRQGIWQIVAEQVMCYYADPASGTPEIGLLRHKIQWRHRV